MITVNYQVTWAEMLFLCVTFVTHWPTDRRTHGNNESYIYRLTKFTNFIQLDSVIKSTVLYKIGIKAKPTDIPQNECFTDCSLVRIVFYLQIIDCFLWFYLIKCFRKTLYNKIKDYDSKKVFICVISWSLWTTKS